jgi:minor extracellular serine protease Vpr
MKTLSTLLMCCLLSTTFGQSFLDARSRHYFAALEQAMSDSENNVETIFSKFPELPIYKVQGVYCLSTLALVDSTFKTRSHQEAYYIGSVTGDVATLKIPLGNIVSQPNWPGVKALQISPRIMPDLERAAKDVRVDSVWQGIQLPQGFSGAGVLIGITDWGYDYSHPTFLDTALSQYRIRGVWDHFRQSGPAPAGFHYGTEITNPQDILAAESDTFGVYENATHGNHVAGIAAGSGGGTPHRGIAFGAQLLLNSLQLDAASSIDAFHWMKQIADADGKRLVINMSWGLYYVGPMDGTSLISRAIDTLSAQGIVFVTSAGNNGNVNFHIRKDFQADTLRSRIQFYPYSLHPRMWGQCISIWGTPGAPFAAGFEVYDGANVLITQFEPVTTNSPAGYLDSILVIGQDTIFFNILHDNQYVLNNRPHIQLRINNKSAPYRIVLKAHADSGVVHFWNVVELDNGMGNWGQDFIAFGAGGVNGNNQYGLGEPSSTESVITVASHVPDVITASGFPLIGDRSNFSSIGPVYDGRMKPDLSAPGSGIISAVSSYTNAPYTPVASVNFNGRNYPFAAFSGTSMSSPMVAGVAALLLEASPGLTPFQVRAILRQTARTDARTGALPATGDPRWGNGKTHAYAAIVEVLNQISVSAPAASISAILFPNPAQDRVSIVVDNLHHKRIPFVVVNQMGQTIHSGFLESEQTIDIAAWPAGIYLWRIGQDQTATTLRMVK